MEKDDRGKERERKRDQKREGRVTTYSHHDALTPNIYLWNIVHSAILLFKCSINNKRYI